MGGGALDRVPPANAADGAGAARSEARPKPRWSDDVLLEQIRAVLAASPFLGEGHRKVWARLRWQVPSMT